MHICEINTTMSELISIQSVTKQYANHKALDKISISIEEGSIFGLLGPNGAGKTSLIRILNQITAPDEGQILFNGKLLNPEHQILIGYLPEERGLYKKMKVGEQALYLAQLKGLTKVDAIQKLKYWFKRFEITDWWDRRVEELSKGMQQKIQFIITVLHEPKLLIFDEPFTGFDPINVNILKEEMLRLNKEGATLILSTHNMESVEALCDNIALIDQSKKILDGKVNDIKQTYKQNHYTVSILNCTSALNSILNTKFPILQETQIESTTHAHIAIPALTSPNDLLNQLMNIGTIIHFEEILPSMNDIFIHTVSNNKKNE